MRLTQRFRNLVAVPSCHFHPVYGREVTRAMAEFAPAAIALEIRAGWESELRWGAENWPTPTVSYGDHSFLAFVPGDSMDEACRLGVQTGVPVFCIDLDLEDTIVRPEGSPLPDPAFAPRVGDAFQQVSDALDAEAGPPALGDLAREAHMALRLQQLMRDYPRVLWVGGMAHWSRIRQRLEAGDFAGPKLALAEPTTAFRRMRLAASALHQMTGRLPFQVAHFARQPTRFTETACLQKLALAAVKPEQLRASHVAAMLRYARNLAAHESIRETPGLWDLLLSASSMLGNEYASRLASLALQDHFTTVIRDLPELTFEVQELPGGKHVGEYKCKGEVLAGEVLTKPPRSIAYRRLPSPEEISRRERGALSSGHIPAENGEKLAWAAPPDEEASYEAFVRHVLELAGRAHTCESTAVPLVNGMGDGIDVRATVRHWHSGRVYVREPTRASIRITNGLIDYRGRTEQARANPDSEGGWIDPDCQNVGSASWMEQQEMVVLQSEPVYIERKDRELSLITLDVPTWVKGDDSVTFYDRVIMPLVDLGGGEHNLYDWLRIMFKFCRNKPFAYCSRYKPSAKIHALAREFGVEVVHVPLRRIAKQLRERHQSFRYMYLTKRQWNVVLKASQESKRGWLAPEA